MPGCVRLCVCVLVYVGYDCVGMSVDQAALLNKFASSKRYEDCIWEWKYRQWAGNIGYDVVWLWKKKSSEGSCDICTEKCR